MNTQKIAVTVPKHLLDMIDSVTNCQKMSRSKFISEAIYEKIHKEQKGAIKPNYELEKDAWDALDIESIAVETGRSDGSVNHDSYVYGTLK